MFVRFVYLPFVSYFNGVLLMFIREDVQALNLALKYSPQKIVLNKKFE